MACGCFPFESFANPRLFGMVEGLHPSEMQPHEQLYALTRSIAWSQVVFFFFEPDEGASRWVPTIVCKWRDIGDPINGWKYMGNWGYFTRKWSYASSRGLLCWNGALSSWNSLLVDCKTVWGPSMIQWYQRSTLCCSLSMFSIVFVLYIYIRRQTYDIFIFIRLHKVCFHMIHTQRTQGPQQTASSDSVLIMIDAIPNGPWAKGLGFENPRIIP